MMQDQSPRQGSARSESESLSGLRLAVEALAAVTSECPEKGALNVILELCMATPDADAQAHTTTTTTTTVTTTPTTATATATDRKSEQKVPAPVPVPEPAVMIPAPSASAPLVPVGPPAVKALGKAMPPPLKGAKRLAPLPSSTRPATDPKGGPRGTSVAVPPMSVTPKPVSTHQPRLLKPVAHPKTLPPAPTQSKPPKPVEKPTETPVAEADDASPASAQTAVETPRTMRRRRLKSLEKRQAERRRQLELKIEAIEASFGQNVADAKSRMEAEEERRRQERDEQLREKRERRKKDLAALALSNLTTFAALPEDHPRRGERTTKEVLLAIKVKEAEQQRADRAAAAEKKLALKRALDEHHARMVAAAASVSPGRNRNDQTADTPSAGSLSSVSTPRTDEMSESERVEIFGPSPNSRSHSHGKKKSRKPPRGNPFEVTETALDSIMPDDDEPQHDGVSGGDEARPELCDNGDFSIDTHRDLSDSSASGDDATERPDDVAESVALWKARVKEARRLVRRAQQRAEAHHRPAPAHRHSHVEEARDQLVLDAKVNSRAFKVEEMRRRRAHMQQYGRIAEDINLQRLQQLPKRTRPAPAATAAAPAPQPTVTRERTTALGNGYLRAVTRANRKASPSPGPGPNPRPSPAKDDESPIKSHVALGNDYLRKQRIAREEHLKKKREARRERRLARGDSPDLLHSSMSSADIAQTRATKLQTELKTAKRKVFGLKRQLDPLPQPHSQPRRHLPEAAATHNDVVDANALVNSVEAKLKLLKLLAETH